MNTTEALKKWLVANKGVAADATEDDCRKAAAAALVDGSLTHEKFVELTADPMAKAANEFTQKIDAMMDLMVKQNERIAKLETKPVEQPQPQPQSDLAKTFAKVEQPQPGMGSIRQITAAERYSTTKSAMTFPTKDARGRPHPMAGAPVCERYAGIMGRQIQTLSQLDKAVIGAWIHMKALSDGCKGIPCLTDHEKELLEHAYREYEWAGVLHAGAEGWGDDDGAVGLKGTKLTEWGRKALIDDTTSGGLEAVPIVFDDAAILPALLFGEFYPIVEVKPITRGRRVEGVVFGELSGAASSEDTNITLFTTASFISAFDTTIFVWAGAIQVGLDFMSDSPIDVASTLTDAYGQAFLKWIDTQICLGDGTTEPEGVITAGSTTTVTPTNTTTGPPLVGDYEAFLFGVTKPYKQGTPTDRIVFAANETTYRRARGIYVGTTDARRVFGMTHEDYMLFGHPYKINGSFTNNQAFFANMARYRCYRRMGMTLKMTTEGQTLTRLNEMLIVARARMGGNLTTGSAAAVASQMMS